jgi:hypothetical protein
MSNDHEPVSTDDAIADAMRAALTRSVADEPSASITWTAVMARARRVVVVRRILAASAAAVAVLGITAGAFAATSTKDRRRVSVVGSATTTTTTTPPGCTHLPTERVSRSYYGLKAPDGPSIDFLHSGGLSPVIDSRGNRAHSEGLEVQRTGPDGTVTLTLGANATVKLNGFGDFDGDGRGDLLIVTIAEDGIYRYYIVLGTVGAGTYAPAAVGVLVDPHYEPGDFGAEPASVGDQNGASRGRRASSTVPDPTVAVRRPLATRCERSGLIRVTRLFQPRGARRPFRSAPARRRRPDGSAQKRGPSRGMARGRQAHRELRILHARGRLRMALEPRRAMRNLMTRKSLTRLGQREPRIVAYMQGRLGASMMRGVRDGCGR